jgi:hypothetical protein
MDMDRGLRAPLSPYEESTLRQIADTSLSHDHLRLVDLERLYVLKLIEICDSVWRVTAMGSHRLETL